MENTNTNNFMVKKVITVPGIYNQQTGRLKQFICGPLPANQIMSDANMIATVARVVPTVAGINHIDWEESVDGNVTVYSAQLTPRAQTKGLF